MNRYQWDKLDYELVPKIGGGRKYVKKKPKTSKDEITYEDFIRDEDGKIVLKPKGVQ
jgi:hypothetical protein